MQTLLNLHFLLVLFILTVGGLALIFGISLLVQRRRLSEADAAQSDEVQHLTRIFRALMWVTAGLGVIQAAFGGLIYLNGGRPEDNLHFVYGGIVLLAIPVAYVYSDQKRVRRDLIIMVIAVVAVIGAAVRALMTGGALPH